jgi:hypothetical protein
MAEEGSVKVADSSIELVANNIQDKVGGALLGTKNLAADAVGISEPAIGILDGIRTLQTAAVEKLSELVDIIKARFTDLGHAERQAGEQEEVAGKKGFGKESGTELHALKEWMSGLELGSIKGIGIAGMAGGIASMLGKAIFSGVTALLTGLVWAIFDGMAGMKEWGGITGFLGGLFGGLSSGLKGAAAGMGKWALIGFGLGSIIPGVGNIIGMLVGALIGGILGWFGGEKITAFLNKIVALPTVMMEKIVEVFTNMKTWVSEAITGFKERISELAGKIFDPVISTFKKILNVIKSVLNSVIDSIPDFGFDKIKELKEKMKFDIEPEGKAMTEGQASGVDSVENLFKATEAVDDGQVSQENIANINKASDDMIANMNAEDMIKDKGYAKYIVKSVNAAVQEMIKMSNAEGLSEADAKQLQSKANQLAEKLKTVQAEYNAVSKSKILVREDGTIIEQLVGDEDDNKLNELEMAKKANELTIAELEKKKVLSRPEKGKLETAKKNLIKNKEEISALSVVPSENIAIDEKVVEDNKQIVKSKALNLEKPEHLTAPVTITKVDGSPTIATNKHISMIEHKGIFPVDPTMMAALAGYSK